MKKILLGAAALITAMGTIGATSANAAPWNNGYGYQNQWERNHDGYHDRWDRNHDRNPYNNTYRDDHRWSRGERIRDWRAFHDVDYRYYRLRPAPYGYRYVRDDRTGDILLTALATGLIVSVIASH